MYLDITYIQVLSKSYVPTKPKQLTIWNGGSLWLFALLLVHIKDLRCS